MVIRKFLFIFTVVLFLFTFSACSRTNEDTTNETASNNNESSSLTIYSPHSSDKTEFILREFRQRTGIQAQIVYEGTGELLLRLAQEQKNGTYNADVFWGGGIESLESNKTLFQPYKSTQLDSISPEYYSDEFYWTGFSVMTMVIIYNTKLVPQKNIPRTWTDLLDPFFINRIIMPDPLKSGSAFSIINTILSSSSDERMVWDFLGTLKKNIGLGGFAVSSSLVHSAVATGEFFVGLTSEDAALSIISDGADLAIVYPSDGTVKIPDGVALVKNAPHKEEAEQFINFVLNTDVQKIVSRRLYRRSVRNDIALPPGIEKYVQSTFLPYDIYSAAEKRTQILKTWEEL